MMFPLRDDVSINIESESTNKCRRLCKIFGIVLMATVIIGSLLLIGEPLDFDEQDGKSDKAEDCEKALGEKAKEEIRSLIQMEIQSNNKLCTKPSRMNPEQMRSLIKEEIKKQQKISLKPDFASASAGGMILSASPTWTEGYPYIYFLFIPIRSTAPTASIMLEPTRQLGDCWPMVGSKGSVIIQLAARANIVGFTVEHVDPAMSLSGGTPEAPQKFSVYGLDKPDDPRQSRHLFGTYTYDNKRDDESQYFRAQNANRKSFMFIEFEVLSNHGNEKYTCIYRFQVHGFIDRAYHCQTNS